MTRHYAGLPEQIGARNSSTSAAAQQDEDNYHLKCLEQVEAYFWLLALPKQIHTPPLRRSFCLETLLPCLGVPV